jgi:hypothetical protein
MRKRLIGAVCLVAVAALLVWRWTLMKASPSREPLAGFSSGSGTVGDPWIIGAPAQLAAIEEHYGEHFALGSDLDLGGAAITPAKIRGGSFDGRGHVIRNWAVTRETLPLLAEGAGLFRSAVGTTFVDVRLERYSVVADARAGALVGAGYDVTLVNVHATDGEPAALIGERRGETIEAGEHARPLRRLEVGGVGDELRILIVKQRCGSFTVSLADLGSTPQPAAAEVAFALSAPGAAFYASVEDCVAGVRAIEAGTIAAGTTASTFAVHVGGEATPPTEAPHLRIAADPVASASTLPGVARLRID